MSTSEVLNVAQVIGAIASLIAVPTSIILYRKTRRRGEILYAFSPAISLAHVTRSGAKRSAEGRLQILYDGVPATNVFLQQMRLHNGGNVPIRSEQVVAPLRVRFPDSVQVLEATIGATVPEGIETKLRQELDSVVIAFELLNPDDRVYMQFICDGTPELPKVSARIEGIGQPAESLWEYRVRKSVRGTLSASALLAVLSTVLIVCLAPLAPAYDKFTDYVVTLGFLAASFLLWLMIVIPATEYYYRLAGRGRP